MRYALTVSSNYRFDLAAETWRLIRDIRSGTAVFITGYRITLHTNAGITSEAYNQLRDRYRDVGENAWLRGAYRVGRGNAMTAVVL